MGGFEPVAKPIFDGWSGVPQDFAFSLLPDDYDQFDILYQGSMERVPAMETTGVSTFLNGLRALRATATTCLAKRPR